MSIRKLSLGINSKFLNVHYNFTNILQEKWTWKSHLWIEVALIHVTDIVKVEILVVTWSPHLSLILSSTHVLLHWNWVLLLNLSHWFPFSHLFLIFTSGEILLDLNPLCFLVALALNKLLQIFIFKFIKVRLVIVTIS